MFPMFFLAYLTAPNFSVEKSHQPRNSKVVHHAFWQVPSSGHSVGHFAQGHKFRQSKDSSEKNAPPYKVGPGSSYGWGYN